MRKHRRLCHPEILEAETNGNMATMFREMTKRNPDMRKSAGHLTVAFMRENLGHLVEGESNRATLYAMYSWWRNDRPVWALSADLAMALTHTDPPMETFDLDPLACVPLSGMFIQLPPVFFIHNGAAEGRKAAIDGIYIIEDLVGTSESRTEAVPGITILGVGNHDPVKDAFLFFTISAGSRIAPLVEPGKDKELLGGRELARLAVNLLWMLQYVPDYIYRTAIPDTPLKGKNPRSLRRAAERLQHKGRTHKGYLLLDLPPKVRTSERVTTSTVRSHIVCGHIHHYWCNSTSGLKPTATKKVGNKLKYLMPRWVLPYRRGVSND
jgi:hypothetical protein